MKQELAKYFSLDQSQITLFWKGRVALYAIFKALGIKEGDEIILPAFTCVVVANPIIYLGARPIYVDIDPKTYNMDISRIENKINNRTRVILAQNTFGLAPDLDKIFEIAGKHNLTVVEDCAHGFGGYYKGQPNGLIADVSFCSTQWNKPFSTGIGGFAITKNADIAAKLRDIEKTFTKPSLKEEMVLRVLLFARGRLGTKLYWPAIKTYRWLSKNNLVLGSSQGDELEHPVMPAGFAKGLSETQANLGNRELGRIGQLMEHRKKIAAIFTKQLQDMQIEPPYEPEYAEHTFLKYPLLVRDRETFFVLAEKNKIELGDWFLSPIHPIIKNFERFYYYWGDNPIAETISRHIINLPTHSNISEDYAIHITQFLKENRDQIYGSYREILQ
ncbi:aminotransferase class I/II-fold pyridoxal phosphate-dependent enzyme [bacterium]|nr:aminotransferase class I/II-fold pyridoxal phosphate-dependent enzyme [bacterium]